VRLKPDRIIIGELRGGESLALLKAWVTGHPGSFTTIHAGSAAEGLLRLDGLVQEAGVPRSRASSARPFVCSWSSR
jgi:type IV secretion system protein VirB11